MMMSDTTNAYKITEIISIIVISFVRVKMRTPSIIYANTAVQSELNAIREQAVNSTK